MYHIKNDQRSIQSSERIYRSLLKISLEKDFNAISIKEIVTEAEVARATFYRNFDYIEDILKYQVDQKFKELHQFLITYYQNDPDFAYSFFIVPFMKFWHLDTTLIELLIRVKKISILRDAFNELLIQEIKNYHQGEDIDISHYNYLLAARSGIAINILVHWVKTGKKESADEVVQLFYEQFGSPMNQSMFGKKTNVMNAEEHAKIGFTNK